LRDASKRRRPKRASSGRSASGSATWSEGLLGGQVRVAGRGYVLNDRLSAGSASASYLASPPDSRETVLVKIFADDFPFSTEVKARLEAAAPSARLKHYVIDSACTWEPTFEGPGAPREFKCLLRGYEPTTLYSVIRQNEKLRGTVLNVLHDIAGGLRSLHEVDITHGDLRPDNVLLNKTGRASLADYALADERTSDDHEQLSYWAPEIFLGAGVSTSSDIYSFGRIVRSLADLESSSRGLPTGLYDRLVWLSSECTRTEPSQRPPLEQIIEVVSAHDPLADVRVRLRNPGLPDAVLSNLEARLPGLLDQVGADASDIARDACQRFITSLTSQASTRIDDMSDAELVHLLGTYSLASHPYSDEMLPILNARDHDIVRIVVERMPSDDNERIDLAWEQRIREKLLPPVDSDMERHYLNADLLEQRRQQLKQYDLDALSMRQIASASEVRARLLESCEFVRSEGVTAIMSRSCPGITLDEVRVLRDLGYLLAVADHGANLFPLFQFESVSGLPYRSIDVANQWLSSSGSTWGALAWWQQPCRYLNNRRPSVVLATKDGDRIVADAIRIAEAA
jgi:serine/threonine protein kinase